ncbi:hypothetical protein D9T04_06310 [Proteus mirabilis]|nr:hypothetical protein GBN10_02875 [Proteus mirabilis]MVD49913.1 hypothetical protein [Proteus mirabilis]MVD72310.1 hypothetical protein [Proteus mirabilis]MVF41087.1 hypothetical protein [Proteus mirabilis]QKQ97082.1 hypothetical protein GCE56_16500 [Proteus mirabilis]
MCIHLNLMIFTKIIRGFISARRVRENELRQLAFQRELLSRPEKKHSNNIKPIFIANKTTC